MEVAEEDDSKDYAAALRCVQRVLNTQGYKRGSWRSATYRLSAENFARRDEYVLRMAVDLDTQKRGKVDVDESYVHRNDARYHDYLYDPTDSLVAKANHKGRRYCFFAVIIREDTTVNALNRVGNKAIHLLPESVDVFEGGKKVKDHAMFDHDYVAKLMRSLIAALSTKGIENCVNIMDNANYHKKACQDKKEKLVAACKKYGLTVKMDGTKVILWDQIQAYFKKHVQPVHKLVKMT